MDAGTFEYSVDRRVGQLPYDLRVRRVESVFFLFASSEVRLCVRHALKSPRSLQMAVRASLQWRGTGR